MVVNSRVDLSQFQKEDYLSGLVLLIDKPKTWTSFDVVNKLRYQIKKKWGLKKIKVGHAGTLDPLATGLLIVCVGKMTKSIEDFMGKEKEYEAEITFTGSTPSFDLETEIDKKGYFDHLSEKLIRQALSKFQGEIMQVPPDFSAIKKQGKKAYQMARAGEEVKLDPRKVQIHEIRLLHWAPPSATIKVKCSKGTYIRSLAHDLGLALETRAHLSKLTRTAIGEFQLKNAWDLQNLCAEISN